MGTKEPERWFEHSELGPTGVISSDDGWYDVTAEILIGCCSCGLVHRVEHKVEKGEGLMPDRLLRRSRVDEEATEWVRANDLS